MNDYKKLIADAFTEHWEKYLEERTYLFQSAQKDLAGLLIKHGYLLSINEQSEEFAKMNYFEETAADEMNSTGGLRFYNYEWEAVGSEIKSWLFTELGVVDGKYPLSDTTTRVEVCKLEWYEQYKLLRMVDSEWKNPKLCLYYLIGFENQLFRLNGTSPPIHEVNAKAPIKLTEENVLSYLIFFCFFVRGEEGPFYILESLDDPLVQDIKNFSLDDKLMEATFSVIDGTARPALLLKVNKEGEFFCEAVVAYSNALFIGRFLVKPTGMIEMLEDEAIAADMPFRINAPVA